MSGFTSGLAAHIQSLLEFKHAMGLPYETSGWHLRQFDAMCTQDYPGHTVLTKDMAMSWVTARDGEHVNGQMRRITPVRQLAKHMNTMGHQAYVIPSGIPGRQIHYRPHLFTSDQLRAFFDAADAIVASPYGGPRHLVIPVIFRMIYCLGLRPGEARRLHRNDVDLDRGAVRIRESKGHKDRIVFMSADVHQLYCRAHDAAISTLQPERVPFFPNHAGTFYASSTISVWFNELVSATGTKTASIPSSARPYDLRHAHVVENINRWARAGAEPEAYLPYLSLHLGHTNPDDTWYYFHLAADFHPDLRAMANSGIEDVLPEAGYEN